MATCSMCGAVPDTADGAPPLTWSSERQTSERQTSERQTSDGAGEGITWACADCTRRFVRSIEAKLDQQWW